MKAYLDIETTGLLPSNSEVTVVGVSVGGIRDKEVAQLVGPGVTAENLLKALRGVKTIYTYNGSRFDLPFLHSYLGVDLLAHFDHHDLMYDCWANNLYGGLKAVEQTLGIRRKLPNVNGLDAVIWWQRYVRDGDHGALAKLLAYNKEDTLNLKLVERHLQALSK